MSQLTNDQLAAIGEAQDVIVSVIASMHARLLAADLPSPVADHVAAAFGAQLVVDCLPSTKG